MLKNGWIACIIVLMVGLCACVFCLLVSLFGITSYIKISPTLSLNLPGVQVPAESPTASPIFVRPSPQGVASTPVTTPEVGGAQSDIPALTPAPNGVSTETVLTLENTFIPINDPIDLARRLLGITDLSPVVAPITSDYPVGSRQSFWAGNGEVENFRVDATLQYVTEHAYFWIQDGIRYRDGDLKALADDFENQIYPTNRAFFGSEWTPGIDGDRHIYILYARGIGDGIAGYFSSADEFPSRINRYSNEHEMFFFNADNSPLDDQYTFGVLAHEFQHMIHWYQDRNEANWVSEGFSELAVLLNHTYSGGFDALYTSQPDLQLNNWPADALEDTTPHYGASFLFLTYFLDRFGESATKALVANQANDLDGVDSTLQLVHAIDPLTGQPITADRFFLDWAVTNYLMDRRVGDGRYTYTSYRGTPRVVATETIHSCPIGTLNRDVHQYGVDYVRLSCPGSHILHFEGFTETYLLPQDPHSGRYAFWANKNDESDTTLTKSFDLTGITGAATLSYWTWYDIEKGWDYAYLEASTDGVSWKILKTPSGVRDDPQGNNYGWGYTGASGGGAIPHWIQEQVDLSQFVGKTVSLRFEYVTDSNVTGEGFLLDDVAIPEIGYSTDFEADAGGWQADGWARIQNILPQNYELALIEMGKTTRVTNIPLSSDITADIPFTIGEDIDNIVLVVTGTTRYTRQLARYNLRVDEP